jgi:hypothetical protein
MTLPHLKVDSSVDRSTLPGMYAGAFLADSLPLGQPSLVPAKKYSADPRGDAHITTRTGRETPTGINYLSQGNQR